MGFVQRKRFMKASLIWTCTTFYMAKKTIGNCLKCICQSAAMGETKMIREKNASTFWNLTPKSCKRNSHGSLSWKESFSNCRKKYLMPQGIHLRNAKCTGRLMMAAEIIHQRKSSTPKEHIFSGWSFWSFMIRSTSRQDRQEISWILIPDKRLAEI